MTQKMKKKEFAQILKNFSKKRSIRQYELAIILNISQSAVSQILTGKTSPSPKVYKTLKRILAVDANEEVILNKLYAEIKTQIEDRNNEENFVDKIVTNEKKLAEDIYSYDKCCQPQDINKKDYFKEDGGEQGNYTNDLLVKNITLLNVNKFKVIELQGHFEKDIANYPVLKLETSSYSPYIPYGTFIFLAKNLKGTNFKKNEHLIVKFYDDNNIFLKILIFEEQNFYLKDIISDEKIECTDSIEWMVAIKSYHFN